MSVFIVGQSRIDTEVWDFQGVFDTYEKALAACRSYLYWILPCEMNEEFPDEPVHDPRAHYPLSARERIQAFCEKYPQTEFGRANVVFSPQMLNDHNLDGTLARLAKRKFPPDCWGEEEISDTEALLRELRAIPEAARLAELTAEGVR